ncbi:MAG: hypothetical protein ACYDCJ_03930 [Gammaproteobacteria bacterium]
MDLPPLFPYFEKDNRLFEDGGVIDNVPIIFASYQDTTREGCDLIFVLSLNSDFEEKANRTSVIARLFRVMDVRQGALERNSFKMLYLYNELAVLRQAARRYFNKFGAKSMSGPLLTAMSRRHDMVHMFGVCPQKSFVTSALNTIELWKQKEAWIAFEVMDSATARILRIQGVRQPDNQVWVALISRQGTEYWDENF